MGTVNSFENENQFVSKQTGGELNTDVDVSCLDSENNTYEQMHQINAQTGSSINSETDTINTEDFINLLKSKVSNLTVNSNFTNINNVKDDADTSSEYLTSINFLPSIQNATSQQIGGGDCQDSDIDTIMKVAKEYLHQHGGGDDIDDDDVDDDSDEDLDDSDEDVDSSTSEKKQKPVPKPVKRAGKDSSRSTRSTKRSGKSKMSKRQNRGISALSESISSESIDSEKYRTSPSETFGESDSESSKTETPETPYIKDSDSINTSSINLVSFENPALTTNLKKTQKSKKHK